MSVARKKRVTQNDVARHANVSNAVVSYVINGGPRPTSEETRERVLRAIAELDYQPDAAARGLRNGRTQSIGFVLQDLEPLRVFTSNFSARLLTGIATELKERNYFLTVLPLRVDEPLVQLRQLLHGNRLDGVIVRLMQDSPQTDPILEAVAEAHIPCVCVERPGAVRFGFNSVAVDDELGGYQSTRFLLDQGHRRIAHLYGDSNYEAAHQRRRGYMRALTEFGLLVDQRLIGGGAWDFEIGLDVTRRWLSMTDAPTAIFAASDNLAAGAIVAAQERDLRVGADIAISGYDDDEQVVAHVVPALTTMRLPSIEMGRRAADLVIRAVEAGAEHRASNELLPVEFIRRNSA